MNLYRSVGAARIAAALTVAGLVSACTLFGEDEVPPPCPEISVLEEASNLTRFVDGPGRDLIDVLVEQKVSDAAGTCEYEIDDDTETGTLSVEMMVAFELNRGPANRDRKTDVDYFVAVTDNQRNILNKQSFKGTVEFPGNRNRLIWTDEPVYLNIPLKAKQTGRNFKIFIGLDLTDDQLQFNRQKIRDRQGRSSAGG